ncbi:MAG TPA: DEAD/DEAH box helicase [Gemmataceae bacterium]|nr:DEAD/DEAH box helicase [Gemmataceae bacterium]
MILVHASVEDGRLLVWGETPPSTPVVRRGRKTKNTPPRFYPANAGAARVAEALAEAAPEAAPRDSAIETRTLWLPALNDQPIPSSPIIGPTPEAKTPPVLTPWSITALPLSNEEAIALLCACVGRDTLGAGVVIGSTLAYWSLALRFAGSLVAAERFVPSLRLIGEVYRASWLPVLSGPDSQRLSQLAAAMPPACRALSATTNAPPEQSALAVLTAFVENLVDALVRPSVAPAVVAMAPPSGRRVKKRASAFASIHDEWLHALRSPDGVLTAAPNAQRQLAEQVRTWQRPVLVSTAAPFRLCFRLEEPAASDEEDNGVTAPNEWQVRYLLQARDDPSLLIPVADAWTPKGRVAAVFKKSTFDSREYLLTTLGQAAAICPPVEASLKTAAPGGYDADAAGAHTFLTETAWLLEQAGFGVLLPAWWTRKGTRQRLTVRANVKTPKMTSGSGLSLDAIIHFDWLAALGDQPLSLRELEMLAQLKTPLVRLRGQWVQVSPEEIQAALDFWKKKAGDETTLRELVRMALGAERGPADLEVSGVEAEGWIADFLGQLEGRTSFAELAAPFAFQGTLRPYQARGYSWLAFLRQWGLGACLADDMGLGKTVQTLALLQREREAGERRPVLLICPTSVVGNWKKEAERFTPEMPVLVHHGLQRVKGSAFSKKVKQHALVLSSYALLHRDRETLEKVDWSGVILDEAQNIKNPETKQAQAARALRGDYRIALTGTPVENHVGDLWSILQFLNPGFLGTQTEFRRRFLVPIQANRDPDAANRLKRLTGPFVLRRLKTDKSIITDLPDKLEMKVFCNLTREQASLYAAVVEETSRSIDESEGIQRKGLILSTLMKLKQVCNHPAQFLGDHSVIAGRSGKLARLTEMLEEVLDAGDRALIFTQFTEMGDLLQRYLHETFGREVLYLHGGVSAKKRDHMVERFQNDPHGPRLFLLSLKAGGTGLNLTAAQHVFHFDRWWNPAVENQATDRAFRIGQTRNVQVHKYVCVGTMEEKIDDMIERKRDVAARVVGTGEGWLTELSNDQLKDLFTLRQEAIGD